MIASNLGVMFFFTIAVAPTIFKVLPTEWTGVYVRQFFPKYDLYLYLGLVAILAVVLSEDVQVQRLSISCSAVFLVLALLLTPRINLAKDQQRMQLFQCLHFLSVFINVLQMGVFSYVLTIPVVNT